MTDADFLLPSLDLIDGWPVANAAAAVVSRDGVLAIRGNQAARFRWASVTKLLTTYAVLVAVEEGVVDLDEPAGPHGSTVRHLLAHASGLPFEGWDQTSRVAARRIYSNTGFSVLGAFLADRAAMPFVEYVREAVLLPLGMKATTLNADDPRGVAAAGAWGPLVDLIAFAAELHAPRVLAPETLKEATTVAFPGLDGVLPGFGAQRPCDWGLGFELRDGKQPHWMGRACSPATFGHFGGSGTFLWVDPARGLALACLTDREFGDWAAVLWPALSDGVLAELGR